MKKLIISVLIAVSLICFSGSVSAASPDEAVMISQQDGLTPLYTTAPDSSLKDHSNRMSREGYSSRRKNAQTKKKGRLTAAL